ncbi:hypothetical protein LTR15_008780 [Elasticomyces elasticus]|nr:hypothetical protein LTR15_008780 [Elasticomyces elasticus]
MDDRNLALFESADDRFIVRQLSEEAGLALLPAANPTLSQASCEAYEGDSKAINKDSNVGSADANTGAKPICLSLQADLNPTPSATAAIRDHLNGGKLQNLIHIYSAKDAPSKLNGKYLPPYIFCLLGACAMTLGCTIPATFLEYLEDMTDIHDGAKLSSRANDKLFEALYGPRKYKNGEAYDFTEEEETLIEYAPRLFRPSLSPHFKSMSLNMKVTLEKIEMSCLEGTCAVCHSKAAKDGSKLLTCGRCKVRKYCSKAHQKGHWKIHKLVCRAPVEMREESIG